MQKKIMILGASILQLPAILKAKEMGLLPVVCDMNPEAVGFREPGIMKEVISTIDTEGVLAAARKHQIDGIMTLATDMPMMTVAKVSHELGLVGVSERTALCATNKAAMRDALRAAGVPIPEYHKVSSLRECREAVRLIQEHGFRCIIKPADNSGSRGVDLLREFSREAVERAYAYSRANSRSGGVIVEEYMRGPEVSVETVAQDGEVRVLQITDKITTGAPYFVEMGHTQPSRLPALTRERIRQVTIAANRAVGIENGPSHTEIIATAEGPKVVELGARMGGDCITTHLVPLSTGIDMVRCCLQLAIGEKPDLTPKFARGAANRYFRQPDGKILSIRGVEEIERMSGVRQVSIVHGAGETVGAVRSSGDRIGFVIAEGKDADQAAARAEAARCSLSVETAWAGPGKAEEEHV